VRLEPSDYSVVRDAGEDPKLIHGCNRRGDGRLRHAAGGTAVPSAALSLTSHKINTVQIQGAAELTDHAPHPVLRTTLSPQERGEGNNTNGELGPAFRRMTVVLMLPARFVREGNIRGRVTC